MTVPVVWRQPFSDQIVTREMASGATLAEIVASMRDALPAAFDWRGTVAVDGEPVAREAWGLVRPKPGRIVTLHLALAGGGGQAGGGSKNTVMTIAAIAVMVGAIAISGGALAGTALAGLFTAAEGAVAPFAAGSIHAILGSAAFGIAGGLLLTALAPPPMRPPRERSREDLGEAGADGNVLARGGGFPRALGAVRVAPPFVCEPRFYLSGDQEVVEALFGMAGQHKFEVIRVGDVPIERVPGLEYEIREGWPTDTPVSLVTRQVHNEAPGIELSGHQVKKDAQNTLLDQSVPENSSPKWHAVTTKVSPDQAELHFVLPQGVYDADNKDAKMVLPLRIRVRRRGDTDWVNLPELHLAARYQGTLRKNVYIVWGTALPDRPTPETNEAFIRAYKQVPGQTLPPATSGWTAHSSFSAGAGNDYYDASTVATTNVRNVALYLERAEFYLDPATFPKGVYDIEVMKGMHFNNANFTVGTYAYSGSVRDFFTSAQNLGVYQLPKSRENAYDTMILSRVVSLWNEHPAPTTKLAYLALRLKGRIDKVTVLASGYVRDWTGSEWGEWKTTANPAPHYRDLLAGDMTRRPLAAAQINDSELTAWRTACTAKGYQINAALDGMSMAEAATVIAACGYAKPRQSETWDVARDRDRSADTIVQMFTPRNLRNFRWRKTFKERPGGFRVKYRDASYDYAEREIVVLDPGPEAGPADRLEEITYVGLVTEAEARTRALFDLKQSRVRSAIYEGEADVENIVVRRGDLCGVNYDVLEHWAGSARVKTVQTSGGNVTGLVLDSIVPVQRDNNLFAEANVFNVDDFFELGARTGAAIRLNDGTYIVRSINASADEADTVTFTTPFAINASLAEGCLVSIGPLGKEFRRLIVTDIRPGDDLTASLSFVDEAPELWV